MTATAPKVTPITAPKRPRRANLRLVPAVDLSEMERVLTETAQQMAPMVSRAAAARQVAEAEVTALQGEREGIVARRDLMERMFAALSQGFEAELADIDRTIEGKLYGIAQREPQPSTD